MEMQDFFTNQTKLFTFKPDEFLNINCTEKEIIDSFIAKITSETGIPKKFLQTKNFYESYLWSWYKINGAWYYYKRYKCEQQFLNELLGEIVSEYFELDTVHYKLAKLLIPGKKEKLGIISKNFYNKDCTYKSAFDYNLKFHDDLRILHDCRNICGSEDEFLNLLKNIKKFFIRDFYVSQQDRTGRNFQFQIDDKIKLAPLYDYEDSFSQHLKLELVYFSCESCIRPSLSKYANQLGMLNIEDPKTQKLLKNDDYFQKLLYKLLNADIASMLTEVENRHMILIPQKSKQYYIDHESKIKKIVLDNKVIK